MQLILMKTSRWGALIILWGVLFTPLIYAQGVGQPPSPAQPTQPSQNYSDAELRVFAKAYVAVQEIRASHEAKLRTVQDPTQTQQIQQEANVKMAKAVEQQGLTPERYTRMLTTVNSNEQLAKKASELIAKERAS